MRAAVLTILLAVAVAACAAEEGAAPEAAGAARAAADATNAHEGHEMGLQKTDLEEGTGAAVEPGQTAVVHYTGWLYATGAAENKGRKFDSSRDAGRPFAFRIGAGEVIAGWDQGVAGMKVGGQRRLVIPSELGYGERGAGGVIPPGATLVFDVELIEIR